MARRSRLRDVGAVDSLRLAGGGRPDADGLVSHGDDGGRIADGFQRNRLQINHHPARIGRIGVTSDNGEAFTTGEQRGGCAFG